METSGQFIREVDTHTTTATGAAVQIVYERKLDVTPDALVHDDVLREVDHEKSASEHQLNILWDVIMTTVGDELREADLETVTSGAGVIRIIDRVDGIVEFRKIDRERPASLEALEKEAIIRAERDRELLILIHHMADMSDAVWVDP